MFPEDSDVGRTPWYLAGRLRKRELLGTRPYLAHCSPRWQLLYTVSPNGKRVCVLCGCLCRYVDVRNVEHEA